MYGTTGRENKRLSQIQISTGKRRATYISVDSHVFLRSSTKSPIKSAQYPRLNQACRLMPNDYRTHMAEIASPVLGRFSTLDPEIDQDIQILLCQNLACPGLVDRRFRFAIGQQPQRGRVGGFGGRDEGDRDRCGGDGSLRYIRVAAAGKYLSFSYADGRDADRIVTYTAQRIRPQLASTSKSTTLNQLCPVLIYLEAG
jgi:hypothetical protein